MITYEWFDEIPGEARTEIESMLAAAVSYDAEAGFSTVEGLGCADGVSHLVVSMPPRGQRGSDHLDALPEARVVAYLRLDTSADPACGQVQFVVREEFRSLGVATLMLERLRDEPAGWASRPGLREVHAWAHGAHPAAERMSWRFGATLERQVFKTVHLLGGRHPFDIAAADHVELGGVGGALRTTHRQGVAPADAALLDADGVAVERVGGGRVVVRNAGGTTALIEPTDDSGDAGDPDAGAGLLDDLLVLGLCEAQRHGARLALLYVDAVHEVLLHVSRELGFFHDQTDCHYALAVASA